MSLRIAHLSDPHFSHITFGISQFFSKRWIGNFNLIFCRKRAYQTGHLWHLPELMQQLNVDGVFITGDFSSTSLDEEFKEGQRWVGAFKEKGLPTYVIPGNHDFYTKKAEKLNRYYEFFSSQPLKQKGVESASLKEGWWYVGLDCALATPPFCAYGLFSEEIERHLIERLENIPRSDRVILANHFPLFPSHRSSHDLKRVHALQRVLRDFPQVKLYLHGHDHQYDIVDKQSEGLPLVINSGSCAHQPDGSFYLIDLTKESCFVQRLLFRKGKDQIFSWTIAQQQTYRLKT